MLSWSVPFVVHTLEPYVAKTTIRLWHDLHVATRSPHEFQSMLAPSTDDFLGLVVHDELRSIVRCHTSDDGRQSIQAVAYAPGHMAVGVELIDALASKNITVDLSSLRHTVWYYEGLIRICDDAR